jgi:hypothetical protein
LIKYFHVLPRIGNQKGTAQGATPHPTLSFSFNLIKGATPTQVSAVSAWLQGTQLRGPPIACHRAQTSLTQLGSDPLPKTGLLFSARVQSTQLGSHPCLLLPHVSAAISAESDLFAYGSDAALATPRLSDICGDIASDGPTSQTSSSSLFHEVSGVTERTTHNAPAR